MSELIWPVLLLGLGDSLNPTTIAIAILVATERHPVPRLLAYTLGTGLTYFLGGLILTIGPAALLQTVLHHDPTHRTYIIEIAIGVAAIGIAAWLWTRPAEQVSKKLPDRLRPRHAFAVGAGITLVDLPTALPYFGAIALIAAADIAFSSRTALLVVFNVAYVLPLLGITLVVAIAGERAAPILERLRAFVLHWSARMLAIITVLTACYLIADGILGLT